MKNLAEDRRCDITIAKELGLARVAAETLPKPLRHEVPTSLIGILMKGPNCVFRLRRATCYWVVVGEVPLEVAQELYDDPLGRSSVRVAGHCACPPPEEWAIRTADGSLAVNVYHIDTQAALNLFVDTLRKYGLAD